LTEIPSAIKLLQQRKPVTDGRTTRKHHASGGFIVIGINSRASTRALCSFAGEKVRPEIGITMECVPIRPKPAQLTDAKETPKALRAYLLKHRYISTKKKKKKPVSNESTVSA